MRFKRIVALFICMAAAWFISGYIFDWVSHFNHISLSMQVKAPNRQSLFIYTSANEKFPKTSFKRIGIKKGNKWKEINIAIPISKATHLRFGFRDRDTLIQFSDIRLNGHKLDLLNATFYQTLNIRNCKSAKGDIIVCRAGGEDAYITFPPSQLRQAIGLKTLIFWQSLCFLLSFFLCLFLYKKYSSYAFLFLKKNYPTWFIALLLILLVYVYYAMRWYAFLPRLNTISQISSWEKSISLIQEQAFAPSLLLGILCAAFALKNKYLKIVMFFIGLSLIFLEVLDCALLHLLNERFSPPQIIVFGVDTISNIWPFVKSYLSSYAGIYTVFLSIIWIVLCVYAWRKTLHNKLKKVICVFAVMGFIWYLIPSSVNPSEKIKLHDWPRLYISTLLPSKNNTLQTTDFELTYQCQEGLNSRKNIIIIVVESLSSYMSKYFSVGKGKNWTPNLDKLAEKYFSATDYRTTNSNTTQALFAMFTGFPAINYLKAIYLYHEPKMYQHTLPKTFHQSGYHTAFFTSASFVYSKSDVLEGAGFDEISKDNNPFYNGKKRFVFNSVSDDVLYDHAENWIENYNQKRPYLLILKTTTSHSPFIDPESGEESVEKTIRYADKAFGDFIVDLEQKHILDNTLVVITADHQSMHILTEQQNSIFGEKAVFSIPFVLIDSNLKGKQNLRFTHIDLAPSLEYLALPKACFHSYQQNIFAGDNTRSSCTMAVPSSEPGVVVAQCPKQDIRICLKQNSNEICGGELPDDTAKDLISFITWIRDNNRY